VRAFKALSEFQLNSAFNRDQPLMRLKDKMIISMDTGIRARLRGSSGAVFEAVVSRATPKSSTSEDRIGSAPEEKGRDVST
jgi:hypothetical protein